MLKNYIKIAWKVLGRNKFFTFVSLFGISFTLAVLLVVATLLEDLLNPKYPETNSSKTLTVQNVTLRNENRSSMWRSNASFYFLDHYVKKLKTPALVSINSESNNTTTFVGDKKLKLKLRYTCENYWKVFDFDFIEGKPYGKKEIDDNAFVTVITESTRDDYFGKGVSAVGKSLNANNANYTVLGVVKDASFLRLSTDANMYTPYNTCPWDLQKVEFIGGFEANLMAHSRSDLKAIKAEFDNMIKRIEIPAEEEMKVIEVKAVTRLEQIAEEFFGSANSDDISSSDSKAVNLFISTLIIGMLLFMLLPAVNLVNLNTSRIMERASEIGVRKAFGATSSNLTIQFLVENILLTLIGGGIGLILAYILVTILNNSGLIPNAQFQVNFTVFLAGLVFCLVFGLLSGVLPALRMSKMRIVNAIKGSES
ncbi:MAG: FtsX-like permease family protein [Saprospiraceae bacterium]